MHSEPLGASDHRSTVPAATAHHDPADMAVAWGRAHVDLTGIAAIGIDEIQWQRGHRYLTLV